MKSVIIIGLLFSILGCYSSKKYVEHTKEAKYIYSSGDFSGIDYIIIIKKSGSKKIWWITIDCNHYIKGMGKTLFISKTLYDSNGKYTFTMEYIKDSIMYFGTNYLENKMPSKSSFIPLSNEEVQKINTSFKKFPAMTQKYSLDIDTIKNYLGWSIIK